MVTWAIESERCPAAGNSIPCRAPAHHAAPRLADIAFTFCVRYLKPAVKAHLSRASPSVKMIAMETRDRQTPPDYDPASEKNYEEPGLGAWIRRNPWLLVRLFIVVVFTFGASTTAANFSYGLEGDPIPLSIEQLNRGELPSGIQLGDYVEVSGTPDFGPNPQERPHIAISSRYEASYFYFGLEETGDNLLIQTAQTPPDVRETGEQVWRGKLATVGTVIFHDTTHSGLEAAGLPTNESIPVIETGDTPEYYRQIFPAYSAIIGLWVLSVAWLLWIKNKPILGL